jgi:tetratricopeptide (TPR) repeat protein
VAIPLFELTLAAREQVLGPDHPSTLNTRGSLATAYRDMGRVADAIPLFKLTLAARERVLGRDHPDTLISRNNLANAYRDTGRIAEAVPLIEQMLAARERMLGTNHQRTLASRNNLAVAYRQTGRVADAIPLFEQNLAACERLLGADHPRTGPGPRGTTSLWPTGMQPGLSRPGQARRPGRDLCDARLRDRRAADPRAGPSDEDPPAPSGMQSFNWRARGSTIHGVP